MIISFAGHSVITAKDRVKEILKEQIRQLIANETNITCYLGGYGDFDNICATVCRELKHEFAGIELVYVAPYLRLSEQTKIKEMQFYRLCDTSVYPPIENVPPKFAILKRNEWMMTNADTVIVYVHRNYGGAYQSLLIAKRKQKQVINICDFIKC